MGMVESTVYPRRDHAGTLLKCGFKFTRSGMGHDFVFPTSSQEMPMSTLEIIRKSYGWVCRGVCGCGGGVTEISWNEEEIFLHPFSAL